MLVLPPGAKVCTTVIYFAFKWLQKKLQKASARRSEIEVQGVFDLLFHSWKAFGRADAL
jgi:hypothetical protein